MWGLYSWCSVVVKSRNRGKGLSRILQVVLVVTLKAYRRIVSPLYGPRCRFFPSCSAYALEAATIYSPGRAVMVMVRRLLRCHPWSSGGVDPLPFDGNRWMRDDRKVPKIVMFNHPHVFIAEKKTIERCQMNLTRKD